MIETIRAIYADAGRHPTSLGIAAAVIDIQLRIAGLGGIGVRRRGARMARRVVELFGVRQNRSVGRILLAVVVVVQAHR